MRATRERSGTTGTQLPSRPVSLLLAAASPGARPAALGRCCLHKVSAAQTPRCRGCPGRRGAQPHLGVAFSRHLWARPHQSLAESIFQIKWRKEEECFGEKEAGAGALRLRVFPAAAGDPTDLRWGPARDERAAELPERGPEGCARLRLHRRRGARAPRREGSSAPRPSPLLRGNGGPAAGSHGGARARAPQPRLWMLRARGSVSSTVRKFTEDGFKM